LINLRYSIDVTLGFLFGVKPGKLCVCIVWT
jgi:hypothetical protein